MTDPYQLSIQVRRLAWGYFFLYVNFTLNGWNILPPFVGWLLFHRAIQGLKKGLPKLALLENFALVLCAWSVLEWLPVELPAWLSLPGLVIQMMKLYFHFHLFTELAGLAGQWQEAMGRQDLPQRILKARTGTIVVQTAFVLSVSLPIPASLLTALAAAILFIHLGLCLYTMWVLFSLAGGLKGLSPPV